MVEVEKTQEQVQQQQPKEETLKKVLEVEQLNDVMKDWAKEGE